MRKKVIAAISAVLLVVCALVIIKPWDKEAAEPTAAEVAWEPEDSRRVILCMGEKSDTVFISWQGDERGPYFLRISDDKISLPAVSPVIAQKNEIFRGDYYRYKVKLTGLEAGKTYYYEIGDGIIYESPRFFSMPRNDGEDVFAYLGDPQFDKSVEDYEAWGVLTEQMHEEHPEIEFAVLGGDMVNLPRREDHWRGFIDNCGIFGSIPVATVPGNHEGVTSNNTYKKMFHHIGNGPYGEAFYWFERQHCRFVMLDSSFLTKARQMTMGQALWTVRDREIKKWIEDTLAESDKTWNIVVIHHPVYGMHDMFTVSKDIRDNWLPILENSRADLVLCGHQHVYMRTRPIDGIVYVMGVSGAKRSKYYTGSNQPVYSEVIYSSGPNYQKIRATDKELELISYNKKGSVVDAARISKKIRFPYSRIF